MIERISRAMCIARRINPDGVYRQREDGELAEKSPTWKAFEQDARAAIEAMMEPSEEMVKAGKPYAGVAASSAKRTYQAMLTAALADAPGEG